MIGKPEILELRERVSGFEKPVLSIYVTVNPGLPKVDPKAVHIRVKNALKRHADIPASIVARVLEHFDGLKAQSRSLAVFADANHIEALPFEVHLVDDVSQDEVDLHFGEAYFTPLLVALDQHEPYLVLHADRDRLRVFEVFMGQIAEEFADTRDTIADEQDDIETSTDSLAAGVTQGNPTSTVSGSTSSLAKNGPSFVADRADASNQLMQERVAHSQAMFYKSRADDITKLIKQRGMDRLILMGPERDTHVLKEQLPEHVAAKIVDMLPSLTFAEGSAAQVLARVTPAIEAAELAKEEALIKQIRERGMWGLDQCLKALQEGRLHTVAVPVHLHQDVFLEEDSRYVALSVSTAEKMGQHVQKVDLAEKLPNLAAASGARLEFVHGEAEQCLIQELGGMAGLRRW